MYGGPLHAIQDIAAHEGWRTFYKGYATILLGVPSTALYMTTYQTIKSLVPGSNYLYTPLHALALKKIETIP